MSARYFWAVGGGGQHIAIALCRIARLASLEACLPQIIAIDADTDDLTVDNKPTVAKSLKLAHAEISKSQQETVPDLIWVNPLGGAGSTQRKNITFSELAQEGASDLLTTQHVVRALFTDSDAKVDVSYGMRSRGSVGATILQKAISGWNIPSDSTGVEFLDAASKEKRVVRVTDANHIVAGSLFGGTGAGGVPSVSMMLNDRKPKNLIALVQAPWFDLEGQDASTDAKRETRNQNAASAMNFYQRTKAFGARGGVSTVIAEFPSAIEPLRPDQKNRNQSEHIHGYNVAWAIFAANWLIEASSNGAAGILSLNQATLKTSGSVDANQRLVSIDCGRSAFLLNRIPLTQWFRWRQITRSILARGAAMANVRLDPTDALDQLYETYPVLNDAALSAALTRRATELADVFKWFGSALHDPSAPNLFECPEYLLNHALAIDQDETTNRSFGILKHTIFDLRSTEGVRSRMFKEILAQPNLAENVKKQIDEKPLFFPDIATAVAAELERRIYVHVRNTYKPLA